MSEEGFIELSREVVATRIPSGEEVRLPAETAVLITQALGGTFTVHAGNHGGLFRIRGEDADALGRELPSLDARGDGQGGPFEPEKVWDQLRNCYDPEIPVNIVDLGLIYSVEIQENAADGVEVSVKMTLTAPGCGMGPALAADARQRILTVPGVAKADVDLVWEPPWSPDLISAAGRERLGME
jgi:probable FeS assembly SUF system protein SufT